MTGEEGRGPRLISRSPASPNLNSLMSILTLSSLHLHTPACAPRVIQCLVPKLTDSAQLKPALNPEKEKGMDRE